ncbi:hypothetical protein DFH09DRAFT_1364740 [Mycena vulgaris]|nr:hypothetical protein DFH09DRAFT_1364740 [Mycena vulgaris]
MNGLWKLATDAAGQASALGAQAAEAVSPHANNALSNANSALSNAAKSVQISEEQMNAAKRAAEAVGQASAVAAVAAGAALGPHANDAFNAIKSAHIPKEYLDAAAGLANQAAVGTVKVAGDAQKLFASLDPDVQRKVLFVGGGAAVGLVAAPLVIGALGFTPSGVAAGSAAAGIQSGIGNVAAGSVFAGLQSAGVLGLGPGACAAVAGFGGITGHFLDELTRKNKSKL